MTGAGTEAAWELERSQRRSWGLFAMELDVAGGDW